MKLSIKLKSQTYRASEKESVLRKARGGGSCYMSSSSFGDTRLGTYFDSNGIEHVKVYTLQKYNKKTSQTKVKSKKGEYPKETKSKIIRPKEWVCIVYYIPVPLLQYMGKQVTQKDRTFKILQK